MDNDVIGEPDLFEIISVKPNKTNKTNKTKKQPIKILHPW